MKRKGKKVLGAGASAAGKGEAKPDSGLRLSKELWKEEKRRLSKELWKVEDLHALLDSGVDMEEQAPGGWRLVHSLARDGKAELLKALLDRGAQPDPQKEDGWTPMMLALFNANWEACCVLVGTADLEVKNSDGQSCQGFVDEYMLGRIVDRARYAELLARERARREREALDRQVSSAGASASFGKSPRM